jgi:hypothetical protein
MRLYVTHEELANLHEAASNAIIDEGQALLDMAIRIFDEEIGRAAQRSYHEGKPAALLVVKEIPSTGRIAPELVL